MCKKHLLKLSDKRFHFQKLMHHKQDFFHHAKLTIDFVQTADQEQLRCGVQMSYGLDLCNRLATNTALILSIQT